MVIATIIHGNNKIATINIPSTIIGINDQLEFAFSTAQNHDGNMGWDNDPLVTMLPNAYGEGYPKAPRSTMVGDHIIISYPTTITTTTFKILPNGFDIIYPSVTEQITSRLKPHAVSLLQRVSSVCQDCVSHLQS